MYIISYQAWNLHPPSQLSRGGGASCIIGIPLLSLIGSSCSMLVSNLLDIPMFRDR